MPLAAERGVRIAKRQIHLDTEDDDKRPRRGPRATSSGLAAGLLAGLLVQ